MKLKAILLTLTLSIFSTASLAGAGHDHGEGHSHAPITQQQAETSAMRVVSTMVSKQVIDALWEGTPVAKSEQKTFGTQQEWVVSFKNDAIEDPEKRTLYVFFSLTGQYLAANYTGD